MQAGDLAGGGVRQSRGMDSSTIMVYVVLI